MENQSEAQPAETVNNTTVPTTDTTSPSVTNDPVPEVAPSVTTDPVPEVAPSKEDVPSEEKGTDGSPKGMNVDTKPEDVRYLTIKNLDTGEEFIIGENDPDFDFDTFEIGARFNDPNEQLPADSPQQKQPGKQDRVSWWRSFFNYIYGKNPKDSIEDKVAQADGDPNNPNSTHAKPRTPFTKLSSFRFRKELGRGAFGRVLLAEAKTDGKLYALKIISKKNMRSSDRRQAKAERDILFCMTLKAPHPFTSGLKFAFQSENHLYLGMDYIPGGNLRELIKRFKYLPEDWVQFYAAELILAISHLHSLNVLYRDIKPHNVMIDAKGHLILIDFGLSKQEITHPRGALSLVGTPDYSAPEVLRTGVQQIEAHNREKALRAKQGKKYKATGGNPNQPTTRNDDTGFSMSTIGYGKAADWWSLGIMIYEMLAGKPTFRGQDLRETYQKILYARLEFHPDDRFSPEAKSLLEGLINRDPSLRLGAWENPPKDIMSSPFFSKVRWDAIFERRQDGPWLPELPGFYRRSMLANKKDEDLSNDSTFEPINFTPAPFHRMTEDVAQQQQQQQQHLQRRTSTEPLRNNHENDDEDEEEEEEEESFDDELPSQELTMRDSVFISGQNEVPGWSYIDENVLMSYINSLADKKEGKKEKKVKKEKKISAEPAAESAPVVAEQQPEAPLETIPEGNNEAQTPISPVEPQQPAEQQSEEQVTTTTEEVVKSEDVEVTTTNEA